MSNEETSPLAQMADELKLQAWLARAEFRHPSMSGDDTRKEVSVLANMRDEIRVQAHLGKLEARDEMEELESQWLKFKHAADRTTDAVAEDLHGLLRSIRDQSQKLLKGGDEE